MSLTSLEIRSSIAGDRIYAEAAARLIAQAARDHDIATRDPEFLQDKIITSKAVVALQHRAMVGFGYYCDWQGGRFVSHSGLVVHRRMRGSGLGHLIKQELFAASRRQFPRAIIMSLTSSPAVQAMNRSLGFRTVPLDQLTTDPEFWEGCRACRNFAAIQSCAGRCCCEGMIQRPEWATQTARSPAES